MTVQTVPTIDIDLDLVVEDHTEEPCRECEAFPEFFPDRVATWYLRLTSTCNDLPNPMPLCEDHKAGADDALRTYGPKSWMCGYCGHTADVVDVRRIRR
jgi:hypothetical protein